MIDKDIEIVKEMFFEDEAFKPTEYVEMFFHRYQQQAIENVLSEFQGLRDFSTETVRRNAELQEELETYKKIAEKLAEKLVEIEDGCKHIPTEICNKYSNGRCKQCIIEWERNEVEKDESKRFNRRIKKV